MNIDPKQAICGLRPALLKRIFSRRDFTTGNFARTTKLKAEATAKLEEIAAEGWVIRHPHLRHEWTTTLKGDRLAAASLTAPITVAEARDIVRDVVAAAEAIAADITRFYAVERLVLFSDLTGQPGASVRDVDLGYDAMSREPKLRLVTQGLGDAGSFKPLAHYGEIPRRLKVHGKVSLVELRGRDPKGGLAIYDQDAGKADLPW